jgi:hypothetical protein
MPSPGGWVALLESLIKRDMGHIILKIGSGWKNETHT